MSPAESHQYVGPYRLEKTLGKGQTGNAPSLPFHLLLGTASDAIPNAYSPAVKLYWRLICVLDNAIVP